MAHLMGKMGMEPILSVRQAVTISIMLTFDGVGDGDGHGVGTCKQALINVPNKKYIAFRKYLS